MKNTKIGIIVVIAVGVISFLHGASANAEGAMAIAGAVLIAGGTVAMTIANLKQDAQKHEQAKPDR
jgi:hypothetical protein